MHIRIRKQANIKEKIINKDFNCVNAWNEIPERIVRLIDILKKFIEGHK